MRVTVTPPVVPLRRGVPAVVTVTVQNPHDIIAGASLRVLGADPSWVQLSDDRVSVFPGESQDVVVTLDPPVDLPAGARRVAVQVQELTPPHEVALAEVVLEVPPQENVSMRVDPLLAHGGRSAAFGLVVENHGNTVVQAQLRGHDEEERVRFEFRPAAVDLAPGEHAAVEVVARARRPLTGNPVVRPLTLHADTRTPEQVAAGEPLPEPLARSTFLQRARFGRGLLSLLGLLVAVSVFATVITLALSGLVTRSAADRDLALQVAAAREKGAASSSASLAGTVRLLTSKAPVPGVTVQLFPADATTTPEASTATDAKGAFALTGLAAGSYKLRFIGAGFAEIWYPGALSAADGTTVQVKAAQNVTGLDVLLGGLPASVAGKVVGGDVSGATVTLTLGEQSQSPGAVVTTVPVGADGTFSIPNVASPAQYDLLVGKPGYATTSQPLDLGGGEQRTGMVLRLVLGDGLVSGVVTGAGKPLGGATVRATAGTVAVTTLSLTTKGQEGQFVLRSLPTPAQLTVVVSAPGFASQTIAVSLAAGAQVTGLQVDLGAASGTLSGHVVTAKDGQPAKGVTVTVTNGADTFTTVTQSEGDAGGWTLTGLPVPGTYSVTFRRNDLSAQTLSVGLDARGAVSAGSGVTAPDKVDGSLSPATAILRGTVTQPPVGSTTAQPTAEADVTLTNGTTTWQITTASVPAAAKGTFVLADLPPGTYTVSASRNGTRPTSQQITLSAGDDRTVPLALAPAAILKGKVTVGGKPAVNALVVLYVASQYPGVSVTQVQTGADGTYQLPEVQAPQNYVIEVQLPAGSPLATRTVTTAPSATSTIDFALPAAQ
ncbi:MAG TPA: carboxypeptidase-like regulatory domain-containing protein [Motilibacteraceae bacterium]|nr:carboxypeptidase-like regulatory domain-containing protein [Motilibacteraceae bacterium]